MIGDKRRYLTCLVMIDQENVEKFAQDQDVPFTNYASLCRATEVQELIGREIEKVNANSPAWRPSRNSISSSRS